MAVSNSLYYDPMSTITAKSVLNDRDYRNYRNIRACAVLFILIGVLFTPAILLAVTKLGTPSDPKDPPIAVFAAMSLLGISGIVGGLATLMRKRKLAWLMYGMAGIYLFAIPIGTLLSIVVFVGLNRYLKSIEQLEQAGL